MPQELIEQRFNITGDAGVVIEMVGKITKGMMGTAFLYTNKESITFGIGCMLSDFKKQEVTPYQLLDDMRAHPSIAPLLEGGEMKEYAAPPDSRRRFRCDAQALRRRLAHRR